MQLICPNGERQTTKCKIIKATVRTCVLPHSYDLENTEYISVKLLKPKETRKVRNH